MEQVQTALHNGPGCLLVYQESMAHPATFKFLRDNFFFSINLSPATLEMYLYYKNLRPTNQKQKQRTVQSGPLSKGAQDFPSPCLGVSDSCSLPRLWLGWLFFLTCWDMLLEAHRMSSPFVPFSLGFPGVWIP